MLARARQAAWMPGPQIDLSRACQWLMIARLAVLYGLLLVGVIQQIFQTTGVGPSLVLGYALLCVAFGFNALSSLIVERLPPSRWVALTQVAFDCFLISVWIFLSDGKESLYSLLYLIQILSVALILYQRAALGAALGASVGLAAILFVQGDPGSWMLWGVNTALFFTLGMVGGYLSEELQRTTLSLADKSRRVDELIALQQRILSEMPTGVLTVDAHWRIGFLNPAASHLLGLETTVVGKTLQEAAPGLLPFFERSESRTRLQQVVEFQQSGHAALLRGDVAALEGNGAGGLLHGESTEGFVLLFQDVTKVLNLEQRVKQNEKLAAVGQLAAGIAHEIRNPLAGMSASVEMLRSSLPREVVGGENQKLMDIALREIDRLNRLISEFLDFVKPANLKLEPVDLPKLIADVLFALRHPDKPGKIQSLKGGVNVRTDIELREAYEPDIFAHAQPEKLRQVLLNLVINAIQSMDKPGVIEVGCARAGTGRVRFWVRDQGQGMSEKTLSHLYEPFFTTKEKGTGLGLATAYKIIEAMRGEIRVQSTVGKGTEFEIHLPAVG
ncbi:hypothetical protein K2X33_12165 [bacterium]|nr:hypothetical protein [bacterium]